MADGIEREIKLSAADDFVVPRLADLVEGASVDDSGTEPLEATYWDSDGLDLARRGYGLRHRRRRDQPERLGIWTLKTPSHREGDALVRGEHEVEAASTSVPTELLARLSEGVDPDTLHPVAMLRTQRRVLEIRSADGARRAEVVDDRVEVHAQDGGIVERFRELEVEIAGEDPGLANQVVAELRAAGAGAAENSSKYARALLALGHDVDSTPI